MIVLLFSALGLALSSGVVAEEAGGLAARPIDSSFKFKWYVAPQFPSRLGWQGVTVGEVRLCFELDANGALQDWLVIAYTDKAFADSTVTALRQWLFEPARQQGKPVASVGEITMRFERNNVALVSRFSSNERPGRDYVYQPHEASRLDRVPQLLHVVEPFYPRQYYVEGATGSVTLEFYVDESGRVRVPVVTEATEDFLAATAVAAVKEWRFEPATSQGKRVLAHFSQRFRFDPASRN